MKLLTTASLLAGVATALVIPDEPMMKQLTLLTQDSATNLKSQVQDATQSWWNSIPEKDTILTSFEEAVSSGIKKATSLLDFDPSWPEWGGGPHHPPHHGDPDKTIYELIKASKYTTKFAELIEDYDSIKDILKSTKANHTLFVPTDKAFERIPDKHKKPSKDFIDALLQYHIVPGLYPSYNVSSHLTLPTQLMSHSLGHHKQRIRIRTFGLIPFHKKIFINFFAKVVAADIVASNGVIHGIDHILIPPPPQEMIIKFLPSTLSTFRLGMEITGLGEELSKREKEEKQRNGGVLFAPTNRAFAKLGPRANAFLFSDYGKKYLKALLKYHVVANRTLYSDEFYEEPLDEESQGTRGVVDWHPPKKEYKRVDLPSLLEDKPVSVGITRWKGFVKIMVNKCSPVVIRDGVAQDGVVQVVGKVLIPPHKHKDDDHEDDDNEPDHDWDGDEEEGEDDDDDDSVVDLDDLKARLEPYLEDSTGAGDSGYLFSEDL
ncbi:Fasciclin-domain-containing protein [Rhypophila decipiens]|uniref:Fasciclin-domain-containing protein n=1 Tax=Rhypophila decipiens TaxID=261697 RepID=A0AAN6Y7W8_9PEZI|nr:Fasciclin-domain-containing protein [Rhypophila decipiens]